MAALSIRDLDDAVREKLRLRAARNGRSLEAEIRLILTAAAAEEERPRTDLFTVLAERFGQLGGVDLDVPARAEPPRALDTSVMSDSAMRRPATATPVCGPGR